ncbi:chromosome segregation protein SMC [Taklimakanibacter lacteus]|uniref:chromosome segregation protein SMC n=1 Tax=Taklimakanibacter lacteus TaxID=2268456 RepID=UPI000E676160
MKFSRLRLSGFKSFVEPTELVIEKGLTGVVGPNGCGKSNLLEALRWVMGENSYKSMRASGMDDVIFSGTAHRPARNMAEVLVTMDNAERTAPAQFNDNETLEISRRIEREAGSAYRINGRDVRARDVQLLFADASTGARSPALVRQGQIGEIISAKPQARRLILEEAAGITGLHTRRHEAELKLKAAEQNVARLEDVIGQLQAQLSSLKRQARQAAKYKSLSAEIRRLEAAGLYLTWKDAADHAERDAKALDEATRLLAEHTQAASEALRHRDDLGDKLPGLREQETVRAAVLQRLSIERSSLDEEEKRAEARRKEFEARLVQAVADLGREEETIRDTTSVLERLGGEDAELRMAEESDAEHRAEAALKLQEAAEALARAQEVLDEANMRLSDLTAKRNAAQRVIDEQRQRISRFEREAQDIGQRFQALIAQMAPPSEGERLVQAVETALLVVAEAEQASNEAEAQLRQARQNETDSRQAYDDARRASESLTTEVRTLSNLLRANDGDLWPPLVDALKVQRGYETALGAALGEDIDASADEAAPVHWRGLPPLSETHPLPDGAEPLTRFVDAPPALARRLSHIGIVSRALGQALQSELKPGQRLVSVEGDVWRWDGFTAAADAPSAAAKRLAERNRLVALEAEMVDAQQAMERGKSLFDQAKGAVEASVRAERERREAWRAATSAVEVARRALSQHERQVAERLQQTGALDEAKRRVEATLAEAQSRLMAAETELADLPALDGLTQEIGGLRDSVNRERAVYAEARARHDGVEREAQNRADRLKTIAAEQAQWQERARRAATQIEALTKRADETRAAIAEMSDLPQLFADKRLKLLNTLQQAEGERKAAADALAEAENNVRAADQALRAAQDQASNSREEHARLEARLESSRERHAEVERRIAETLNCAPQEIAQTAGLEDDKMPPLEDVERKLIALRDDRERLGGVNLRAEEEAEEVAKQLEGLTKERDDVVQAIAKLRGGIQSLNREGRQRLLDAFGTVNENFGQLFTTLFGGGKAELQLIESEDPLEAGLEILAHPPGKKPTVLSLLSGGEQTLTAMSLIFAVFLTNPSPICVLDEVDAPLDDHNVERFCNLLDAMLDRTETRFLIITHHPLTMARMNRLFGVTMMERGVSQLVSVDLETAEQLVAEAG